MARLTNDARKSEIAEVSLTFCTAAPYQLAATLSQTALGPSDPCLRVDASNAVRLALPGPQGHLAVTCRQDGDSVHVDVLGPDAEWLVPFVPSLLGLDYVPPEFSGPRRLQDLARRFAGLRLTRVPVLLPRIVQVILQQLITFRDASDGWRTLVRRHGTPVAGHDDWFAPPTASVLARLAYHQYVECGILPQHGRRIISIAREARRIDAAWSGGLAPEAMERTCLRLEHQRGVGPWTTACLRGSSMGDEDAVILGDYGLPKQVAYFFTGAEQANDDDMVKLLEPFRPHRFYVLALLIKGGPLPPRRGPRHRLLRDRLKPPTTSRRSQRRPR